MGLITLLPSCVAVDGSAAEFSWILRTFEDDPVRDCRNANIQDIELCWGPGGCDNGAETARFPCEGGSGVTGFEIPNGDTFLAVRPICENGQIADLGTFVAPAPIARTAREGQIMTLNSFLIVVSDQTNSNSECAPAGCTCSGT